MLREPEIEAIAGTGASIIHNPDINGTNCGNCAYVPYMLTVSYTHLDVYKRQIHNYIPDCIDFTEFWV